VAAIATNNEINATYMTILIAQKSVTIIKPRTVIPAQKYSNLSRNNCIKV